MKIPVKFYSQLTRPQSPEPNSVYFISGEAGDGQTIILVTDDAGEYVDPGNTAFVMSIVETLFEQHLSELHAPGAHDPDRPPSSAHAMDDDFTAGALDAKWTKLSNDVTIATAKSIATITPINLATKLVGATQPLGSLVGQSWCWVGKVNHNWANASGDATVSDLRCGLVLKYADIGDKYLGILFRDSIQIDVNRYDAAFSEETGIASVGLADATLRTFWPSFAYIKVVRVGNGVIDIFASCDGVRWVTVANDLSISEPSHVGFCAFATDLTNAPRGYVDWCRMTTSGDIGIIGG